MHAAITGADKVGSVLSEAAVAGPLVRAVEQGAPFHLFRAGGDAGVEEGHTRRESKPALAVLVDAARPDWLRRIDHDY